MPIEFKIGDKVFSRPESRFAWESDFRIGTIYGANVNLPKDDENYWKIKWIGSSRTGCEGSHLGNNHISLASIIMIIRNGKPIRIGWQRENLILPPNYTYILPNGITVHVYLEYE